MNEQEIKGAINGAADDAADKIAAGVARAGDQAAAAVNKFSDGAVDAYDQVHARALRVGETVDPFVRERPYAALAISAALGLVAGLLMTSRGPKVVYVRPPH